ncbi:helix-turn-helix domain-containing protein [Nakamurella lactea]|uniref:helix-turn-helix domain-containing protein n=1 Tax=Nakamurella lactea TaxID=459515 RepID=UPI000418F476|nr:helix-turn-helix transcriptional regulator [Nakamurella lactea]
MIALDPVDLAVYERVLRRPGITGDQLVVDPAESGAVGAALDRLLQNGYLSPTGTGYTATPPAAALDSILGRHVNSLTKARAYTSELLQDRQHAFTGQPAVVEVKSAPGLHRQLTQIRATAERQVRYLGGSPDHDGLTIGEDRDLLARGITVRAIHDRRIVGDPAALTGLSLLIENGYSARVSPRIPLRICLVDDRVCVVTLSAAEAPPQALIVNAGVLLNALAALFEIWWARSIPLQIPSAPAEPQADQRDPNTDHQLVAMMLSGLTDQAIARQLGVSPRTAQRRSADLMRTLGASSRFQAGVQAAIRGWPAPGNRDGTQR